MSTTAHTQAHTHTHSNTFGPHCSALKVFVNLALKVWVCQQTDIRKLVLRLGVIREQPGHAEIHTQTHTHSDTPLIHQIKVFLFSLPVLSLIVKVWAPDCCFTDCNSLLRKKAKTKGYVNIHVCIQVIGISAKSVIFFQN